MMRQQQSSETFCSELLDLLPAYTMGTASPQEHKLVEALLPFCPDAQTALNDFQALGDSLVFLVSTNEAPPPIDALLARVDQFEQKRQHQPPAHWTAPIPPAASWTPPPATWTAPEKPAVSSSDLQTKIVPNTQSRTLQTWLALAAALLLIAFIGTNVYWANQVAALRHDQEEILRALGDIDAATSIALSASNHHRELLGAEQISLASSASFVWNSNDQIGAIVVTDLPPLQPDQIYQLWLVRDGHSLSLGTFEVDENGIGALVFHSPEPIEGFSHIGVSAEPVGGSPNPTTPHLILGNI